LPKAIDAVMDCDLVLYQAGVDCHIDDPFGGIYSDKSLLDRDSMVLDYLRGKPVVWNLAGGYQFDEAGTIEPTLRLHRMVPRILQKLEA
jgi:acetoin utilization deacetylase AcuC-like enzyme